MEDGSSADAATYQAKMQRAQEQMKKSQAQSYVVMDDQPLIANKVVVIKNMQNDELI